MARKTASKARRRAAANPDRGFAPPPARRAWRWWRRLAVVAFLAGGVPVLVMTWFMLRPLTLQQPCLITIAGGQTLAEIARQLEHAQVISDAGAFRLLARLRQQERAIQAGTFRFEKSVTPVEVLEKLVTGKMELIPCTVPEGLTAQEVVARCAQAGLGRLPVFQELLNDAALRRDLKIDAPSLEGYLFPETYRFAPGTSEELILKTMVAEARRHLHSALRQQAQQRGLDELQWLTLASIIQKEAGNVAEMPLIAAVFHNRLQRGMLLQADPTVIYGVADFDGNLTRRHLRTNTPYNTYLNRGLPPGPIANPGLAALQAACTPAEVDYLYFVATGEGRHVFSSTLPEHNRAVRRYQLRR